MPLAITNMRTYSLAIFTFLTLVCTVVGGEIRGKLSFVGGGDMTGEVSVGRIIDPASPFASAVLDVLKTQKGVATDAAGNYVLSDVPENTPVLVIADTSRATGPSQMLPLTLMAGEVKTNVNFTFDRR